MNTTKQNKKNTEVKLVSFFGNQTRHKYLKGAFDLPKNKLQDMTTLIVPCLIQKPGMRLNKIGGKRISKNVNLSLTEPQDNFWSQVQAI